MKKNPFTAISKVDGSRRQLNHFIFLLRQVKKEEVQIGCAIS